MIDYSNALCLLIPSLFIFFDIYPISSIMFKHPIAISNPIYSEVIGISLL